MDGVRGPEWHHSYKTAHDNPLIDPREMAGLIGEYPPDSIALQEEVYAKLLEGRRPPGRIEEQRAEPEQFPAGLVLALAFQRRALHDEGRERVGTREHAVLAADVVQLHGEGVARRFEIFAIDDERQGEALAAPPGDDGDERLEHVRRDPRHDHGDVHV